MEVDPAVVVSIPTSKTVDINKVEDSASCLEIMEDRNKKSPSKERSKTPVIPDQPQNSADVAAMPIAKDKLSEEIQNDPSLVTSNEQEIAQPELTTAHSQSIVTQASTGEENKDVPKSDVPKEKSPSKLNESVSDKVPVQSDDKVTNEIAQQQPKEVKKLKNKALSLDSELITDEFAPKPSTERRRSKIFETAEKFNQLLSPVEPEKPKKIFIPGVNVGGAKAAFERKASLSSATLPQTIKAPVAKVIIDVPADKKAESEKLVDLEKEKEKERKREEEKKRAVDIITGALGKPPMQRKASGSPPTSPQSNDSKKLGLKIPLGPNDLRNATVTFSTPTETKFPFESKPELQAKAVSNACLPRHNRV